MVSPMKFSEIARCIVGIDATTDTLGDCAAVAEAGARAVAASAASTDMRRGMTAPTPILPRTCVQKCPELLATGSSNTRKGRYQRCKGSHKSQFQGGIAQHDAD